MQDSPQVTNGYMVLATGGKDNDIISALAEAQLSSTEYAVVLTILRKTYGYSKKEDWISLSQFVKFTGRSKQSIIGAIASLESHKIITADRSNRQNTIYSFNKRFHDWILVQSPLLVKKSGLVQISERASQVSFNEPVKPPLHTKETITKDNIQKKGGAVNAPTPSQQAALFFEDENIQQKAIEFFTSKGGGLSEVRAEIEKFISYWTEPNKSGTKTRWQLEQTFDVRRRIVTWMNRAVQYGQRTRGSLTIPKGL